MADTDVTKPNQSGEEPEHQLQADGVSAAGSVVMAVAGSAPAYSIAATTATLVAVAGLASPAALLWCALPMLGIAWAFAYLGRADVNAGAAYSWVGRALHPILGFLSGWALVVSATIFMVAGALPAGVMTVALFSPANTDNVPLVTAIGAIWFLVMAACVLVGVRITARAQRIMTTIEVAILVIFAIAAIVHALSGATGGPPFSWDWFGFSHFSGLGTFVAAALVAAFYYWGWDVAANLNEETKNGKKASGIGGLVGVIIEFLLFEIFTIATLVILPAATIEANSGNVLGVLGEAIWPGLGGKLLIFAVMLSTIATLETTLIQVTRTLFAMGRDNTIPAAFGHSHPKWRTPAFATLVVVGVSLVLFIGSNFLGSVGEILGNAISSIGLQIAFYYALAGIAVVIAYRRVIFTSVKNFIFIGLWPALGALFMVWIFFVSIPALDTVVIVIGLGALALGIVPMIIYWRRGAAYFTRRPLELPAELNAKAPENIDTGGPS
jgi:amino acid transporter